MFFFSLFFEQQNFLTKSLTSLIYPSFIMYMYSGLVLSLISFTLTITVSTTDVDLAEPLNSESLFFDQPSSWDESALLSSQPVFLASSDVASLSGSGLDAMNLDRSELLFSSENTNDDNSILSSPFDDPFSAGSSQQAECLTSSESPFIFGKLRARRRDDLGLCRNTINDRAGMVTWPDLPGLQELRTKPNAQLRMNQAVGDPTFNALCYLYSLAKLPYGICSSGDPGDVDLSLDGPLQIWTYGQFFTYTVSHGTFGTFMNIYFANHDLKNTE